MDSMIKIVGGFLLGAVTVAYILGNDVENGDIVYENDDMYVTAAKSKSYGYSLARVNWKKPVED